MKFLVETVNYVPDKQADYSYFIGKEISRVSFSTFAGLALVLKEPHPGVYIILGTVCVIDDEGYPL